MLVTVVIPAYNAAEYIEETVQSVLNQSIKDLEVIILNDGSTDNTGKIIDHLANIHPEIKVIHKTNSGVSDTRNKGLNLAKGKYILFLDADDILTENFLKGRIDFLEENEDYSICGSNILTFSQDQNTLETKYKAPDYNFLDDILLYANNVASIPSNLLYARNHLIKKGIRFNVELASTADKYILIEAGNKGLKSKHLEGFPLHYRIHSNSMSQKMNLSLFRDNKHFFNLLKENHHIPNKLKKAVLLKNHYMIAGMAKKLNLKFELIKQLMIYFKIKYFE